MQAILQKAKNIIYEAITPNGIVASAQNVDNYTRIWSRDAMMTGLAGLALGDDRIIEGFKNSIVTLGKHQHSNGIIPSNVAIEDRGTKISYGSLVGRTDATTWWVIGALSLINYDTSYGKDLIQDIQPKIVKALDVLQIWEYNNRGLVYSPLGGNWADEYVTSGYTLYDNVLYLWALELAGDYFDSDVYKNKSIHLRSLIKSNFDNSNTLTEQQYYHPSAVFRRNKDVKPYFSAALAPNGFDQRWDMAGNALALNLKLYENADQVADYILSLMNRYDSGLIPVFYPVIQPEDRDWHLLDENYGYKFKNYPYQFHNGGFWPIFGGWLCLGLKKYGQHLLAEKITNNWLKALNNVEDNFFEYHDIRNGKGKGVQKLCFSAAGCILMSLNP